MQDLTDFFQSIEFHNIDKHYDQLKSILQEQTFTLEEAEENGLQHTAFEVYNYYANEKSNFERLAEFEQLLKEFQPEIYAKEFHYYAEIRIVHGAFRQDWNRVQVGVNEFIASPIQKYDDMRKYILSVLFYQQTDIITDFTERTYQAIKESDEFYGAPHQDWGRLMLYHQLQQLYERQQFDVDTLDQFKDDALEKWEFDLSGSYMDDVAVGLKQTTPVPTDELRETDVDSYINQIGFHFARYMLERGMPFMTSLFLWETLCDYYGKNRNEAVPLFSLEGRSFETFITRQGGMIMDYRHQIFALLYASLHFYDFLYANQIIDQKIYDYFKVVQKAIRYRQISDNQTHLWEYAFVHQWAKPQMITDEEFAEEQADFRSRYLIGKKEDAFTKKYATTFPKTHFAPPPKSWLEQALGRSAATDLLPNNAKQPLNLKPVRTGKKYGRNEFVTVRYTDGRTKKTKYKKIEADVKAGKCEIL